MKTIVSPTLNRGGGLTASGLRGSFFRTGLPTRTHLTFCLPTLHRGGGPYCFGVARKLFFRTGLPTRTHLMFCLVTDFAPYSCLTRSALLTHVLSGNCLRSLLLPHTRFSPHLLRAHTCAMAGATQAAGSPLCFVFGGCRLSLHGDGTIFAASDASHTSSCAFLPSNHGGRWRGTTA